MTAPELQAVIDGLAPVLRAYVARMVDPVVTRVGALEAKALPAPAEIAPEDIAASVAGLLRKELADLDVPAPPRLQKRIVRNAQGQIERVIEEAVEGVV